MANINKLAPFILRCEARVDIFDYMKYPVEKGFVNDKDDNGGATNKGVTYATYISYCKMKGMKTPTEDDLKKLPYSQWIDILRLMYWNVWKADDIVNQNVANTLVDWLWGSGIAAIRIPQRLLGVPVDGIVGSITIKAVNDSDARQFFEKIKSERAEYYRQVVRHNPTQKKFLRGWLNRLNSLYYYE